MLSKVRLKNVVHFEDVVIEPHQGPNLLIGQSNAGKSALIEAIRTCMGTSKSHCLSNPLDSKKTSFVSSRFTLDEDKTLYATVIRPAENKYTDPRNTVAIHFVIIDGDKRFASNLVKENSTNQVVCEPFIDDFNDFKDIYATKSMDINEERFELLLEKNKNVIKQFASTNKTSRNVRTTCEELLQQLIDKQVMVINFPFSSGFSFQRSQGKIYKDENIGYPNLDTPDILSWYLNGTLTQQEQENEKKYFDVITNTSGFEFRKEDGKIIACIATKCVPLYKVPTGIYDAKRLSILLARGTFKTVCLEDIEMGMHMQMIERLRDLVLPDIKDKVLILTSRHPSFLSPWIVPRTLLFRRHTDNKGTTFAVTPLSIISDERSSVGMKTTRIITSEHFSPLFFARRILFVEGTSEFLFLTTLRRLLLTELHLAEPFLHGNDRHSKEKFQKFIGSLHVVSMAGEAFKIQMRQICKKLRITHYFLLEYDALVQNIPRYTHVADLRCTQTADFQPFLTAFSIDRETSELEMGVAVLEDDGIFIFRKNGSLSGTLHSVLHEICKYNQLESFFRENNCNLFSKRPRLFQDKNLSDDNIRNIIRKVLTISQETETEISRLVRFLFKASVKGDQK